MVNLTFGEQVKIILSRKGMTIKALAELVEEHTGKPMSRQNMTQRLNRDNFQEQDMRLIAEILGCNFTLSIMEQTGTEVVNEKAEVPSVEREVTIGELIGEPIVEAPAVEESVVEAPTVEAPVIDSKATESEERSVLRKGIAGYFKKSVPTTNKDEVVGDINPYTRREYETNSVRMHPKKIGYVQVYNQEIHKWTEMTEWAFLGYQEQQKQLLGKNYKPPIYLD